MVAEDPASVARRYADAWLAGDLDALLACYADGFVLHYFGQSQFAGTHEGKDAAFAALAAVSTAAPRQLLEIEEILSSDTGAVIVARERVSGPDGDVELRRVLRYRMADGQLQECWLYDEDQLLVDRLWSGPT